MPIKLISEAYRVAHLIRGASASFVYNYSDFRGDPEKVLDRCFDVMLYVANFGTRKLIFRFPQKLIDPAVFKPYCVPHCSSVSTTKKSIILDIELNAEDYYDWIDDDEVSLGSLVSLCENLLQGDFRALYLAWLRRSPKTNNKQENKNNVKLPKRPIEND